MISVVIPAYNEEHAIDATLAQVRQALAGTDFELIVVDDGSTDSTGERAAAAGARVITHPHNLGYGLSIKDGIRAAEFDTIAITDADGTYPTDELPKLLQEFGRGFDMVVGARTGDHYRESALKAPLRALLKWLVEFTTGRTIPDVNSGLRVFSRSEAIPYFDHLGNTFSFTTSITLAYMMTSKFVKYVPVPYRPRIGQTKVRLFRDSLRTLQYIVQAILYYNPLKMFLLICVGLSIVGAGAVFAAAIAHDRLFFYFGAGSLAMAVQVFCLGLLAELLRQILGRR